MKHEPNRGDDHEEHAEKRMNLERAVPEHDIKDHRKTHLRQSDDRDPRRCSCGERARQEQLSQRGEDSYSQ